MAPTKLSASTYERLQAELDDLKTRGRVDIARHIEAARMLGDLSENGDYHAAKDSQGKMEARIRQLEAMLDDVEVLDGAPSEEVVAGVKVSLRYMDSDEVERYLVGSIEERDSGSAGDLARLSSRQGPDGQKGRRDRHLRRAQRHSSRSRSSPSATSS